MIKFFVGILPPINGLELPIEFGNAFALSPLGLNPPVGRVLAPIDYSLVFTVLLELPLGPGGAY